MGNAAIWGPLGRNVCFGVKCAGFIQYMNNLKEEYSRSPE